MMATHTAKKLSPIRKIIATRMSEAARTIPHFRLTAQIEVDALIRAGEELQARDTQTKLSMTSLLIKACAAALMQKPNLNVQWIDGEIHQYDAADISIAIAFESGLAMPIIRGANSKTVWEIARDLKDLAARAAKGELKMNEIQGGTFSLSNLGMYGVDQFDAIINAPQCAILAVGRAKPTVVVSQSRQTRVAKLLYATLSCDHRAIDGAAGAEFLDALRSILEQPRDTLFV